MTEARVLVRVDAGAKLGHGHLMRCLAVVRALTRRGVDVAVATRGASQSVARRVAGAGGRLLELPPLGREEPADGPCWSWEDQRADFGHVVSCDRGPWSAVVVDHYRLDARWEQMMRGHCDRIVVIDDLANRPHDADVLVDHNWYGSGTGSRYVGLVPPSALLLLGPRYALLHQEYAEGRASRDVIVHPPRRVVVNFGGTDVRGQSARAVGALDVVADVEVDVVVGSARAVTDELRESVATRPRTSLHVELPTLAGVLGQADLAVGAGGSSTWERLCMRVPALVTTVSDNQSGVTQAFHRAGMTRWIGRADEVGVDDYRAALRAHLSAPSMDIPPIVDGHGATRVGFVIAPPRPYSVRARPVSCTDDAAFVTVAEAGVQDDRGPAAWRRRARWFARAVERGEPVQLLEHAGTPVGVIGGPEGGGRQLDAFVPVADAM